MSGSKADELRFQVQEKIVRIITEKIKTGEMSENRAKEIAQMILDKMPENISYDKLMNIIPTLDDHFQELSSVVVPIMAEYESRMKEIVNNKVSMMVKSGNLDSALEITRKAIEFEKQLS